MAAGPEFRERARKTWSAGDWDGFSRHLAPITDAVLDRVELEEDMELLDVGTGSGGTIAIPAALRGARVTGLDVAPELFEHARRRAADAGVDVEWVDGDASELPFADASFDRVVSTFGAMFAPDHARAAAELVRVCRPDGRITMTTWSTDGFAGELLKLAGAFLPPPPGVQPPPLWGRRDHIEEVFGAAGASPSIDRGTVEFTWETVEESVAEYVERFGPFVTARGVLESQGRWDEFLERFADVVRSFDADGDGAVRVQADYLLISVTR